MAEGSVANLVNLGVSASGEVDSLLIEKFTGKIHEAYLAGENLQSHFEMQRVVGTNVVSSKYLGETDIQVMTPGQPAEPGPVQSEKNMLTVDTVVIASNYVHQLHDVQSDIESAKSKIAKNQTKQLKKLEDHMIIQQLIFGVISNTEAARTTPRVAGHGFSIKVDISDAQSLDPWLVLASCEEVIEQMIEQEMEVDDMIAILPWRYFNALQDIEQLRSRDYDVSTGADGAVTTVKGFRLKSFNLLMLPSNRFPKVSNEAAGTHHKLSTVANAYRYDVLTVHLTAIAVIFTPEAILLGRTLDLQGDIYWDKRTKGFFIESWFSEGCIPDRWDAAGAVFKGGSENTTVKARGNRKASITRTVAI